MIGGGCLYRLCRSHADRTGRNMRSYHIFINESVATLAVAASAKPVTKCEMTYLEMAEMT